MKNITLINRNLKISFTLILFTVAILMSSQITYAQKKMDRIERQTMKSMLKVVKNDVEDNYYDPKFKGINLEEKYEKAKARLDEVNSLAESMGVIAQFLMDFDDSHLFFRPPPTNVEVEYGWRMKMFGDKCFVIAVKPKSNADKQGLKPGDQVLAVEGFRPTKKDLWKINYYYNLLSKRPGLNLVVLKPGAEEPVKMAVRADIETKSKVITRDLFFKLLDESGDAASDYHLMFKMGDIGVWKMPSFSIDPNDIDKIMVNFKDSSSLIMDLRGNGGGYVVTLERLVGYTFDKDIKIADLKGRKEMDPQQSKTKGEDAFKGKLVVLIDSKSGSAAEIFARVVQLEKRGTVIGDVSGGNVMQSRSFNEAVRNESVFFAVSVTNADVIMSDGKSIEHIGVTPDKLLLPTASDLADDRDPVMSEAVKFLGGNISPEKAGSLYKYVWKDDGRLVLELNK